MMCRCCGKKSTEVWRLCKECGDRLQDYLIDQKELEGETK